MQTPYASMTGIFFLIFYSGTQVLIYGILTGNTAATSMGITNILAGLLGVAWNTGIIPASITAKILKQWKNIQADLRARVQTQEMHTQEHWTARAHRRDGIENSHIPEHLWDATAWLAYNAILPIGFMLLVLWWAEMLATHTSHVNGGITLTITGMAWVLSVVHGGKLVGVGWFGGKLQVRHILAILSAGIAIGIVQSFSTLPALFRILGGIFIFGLVYAVARMALFGTREPIGRLEGRLASVYGIILFIFAAWVVRPFMPQNPFNLQSWQANTSNTNPITVFNTGVTRTVPENQVERMLTMAETLSASGSANPADTHTGNVSTSGSTASGSTGTTTNTGNTIPSATNTGAISQSGTTTPTTTTNTGVLTYRQAIRALVSHYQLKANTNTTARFYYISPSDTDYQAFQAAYAKRMLGATIKPDTQAAARNILVMVGIAEGWNIDKNITNVFDRYTQYAQEHGKIDGNFGKTNTINQATLTTLMQ